MPPNNARSVALLDARVVRVFASNENVCGFNCCDAVDFVERPRARQVLDDSIVVDSMPEQCLGGGDQGDVTGHAVDVGATRPGLNRGVGQLGWRSGGGLDDRVEAG